MTYKLQNGTELDFYSDVTDLPALRNLEYEKRALFNANVHQTLPEALVRLRFLIENNDTHGALVNIANMQLSLEHTDKGHDIPIEEIVFLCKTCPIDPNEDLKKARGWMYQTGITRKEVDEIRELLKKK